jgi:hypothetical protein
MPSRPVQAKTDTKGRENEAGLKQAVGGRDLEVLTET